jgi:hypothetical protein
MDATEARQGDVWGPNGIEPGWTVTVQFTDAEMADLLANYDPSSGTSPGVTYCRPVLRAILDAVKEVNDA